MPPSPSAVRHLLKGEMSSEQKAAAFGRFSQTKPVPSASPEGSNQIDVWFGPNATPAIRQLILTSEDTAGILLLSGKRFIVVSDLKFSLGSNNETIIIGQFGDKIMHLVPTLLNKDEILGDVYILCDSSTPNPALDHLKATDNLASDTITDAQGNEISFLDGAELDATPNLTNMRITKFPAAIPLPFHHMLDNTRLNDPEGLVALRNKLEVVHPTLATWFQAMYYNATYFESMSLQHQALNIHNDYFSPLPISGTALTTIELSCVSGDPTSTIGIQFLDRLTNAQNNNMDAWSQANKEIYNELMSNIPSLFPSNPPSGSDNGPADDLSSKEVRVISAKTATEEKSEARIQKTITHLRLLLGQVDTTTDTIVLADLSEEFVDLVKDGTPRKSMRDFIRQFGTHVRTRRSDTNSVIHHKTDMPTGAFTLAFVAAFLNGHWGSGLIQEELSSVGHNLTIFALLRAVADTVGFKRAYEETQNVQNEQYMGETASNTTKAQQGLFTNGKQETYDDLLAAVANLDAALIFMLKNKEAITSTLVIHLRALFSYLAGSDFNTWYQQHAKDNVTWLCHSVLVDVHMLARQMILMSELPANQRLALKDQPIKASTALADYMLQYTSTLQKWTMAVQNNSLQSYVSAPATWIVKKDEKQAKGQHKTPKQPAPSKKPNDSWGRFEGSPAVRPSNPSMGLIDVQNPAALRSAPRLSSGQRSCHDFICKDRSCARGHGCNFAHISTRSDQADLDILHTWADNTTGVTWIGPPRRTSAPPGSNRRSQGAANQSAQPAPPQQRTAPADTGSANQNEQSG